MNRQEPSRRLSIYMLLPDLYDPAMPTWPEVREIYGTCFPSMGHEVTWIAPRQGDARDVREEAFGETRVFTIPHYPSSSLVGKAFRKLRFLWTQKTLLARILKENQSTTNIVQTRESIFDGIVAVYLKGRLRAPFVFQYSFPVSESHLQRYRLGYGRLFYLRARFERVLEAFIMRRADLILPISPSMQEELARQGISRQKMMPLPLAVNPELFSPEVSGQEVRTRYSLEGSSVLLYLGTLDRLRQLDILLYMLAQLKTTRQGTRMLLVGEGDDRSRLETLASGLGLGDVVTFTGQVPYFEVPQFIAAADVTLSPVPPLEIYKVSSPCKLFEYMGVAKPVVANEEIPEHKEVLEQSGGGILVPFTPEGFAGAVMELLDDPARAAKMGMNGREWVLNNRTYDILARRVEEAYYQLLEMKR